MAVAAVACSAGNAFGLEMFEKFAKKDRALKLYNIHTAERIDVAYCSSGVYDKSALEEINRFLRCHYNNEVKPIDVKVIDLLSDIRERIGEDKEVLIISGYRSPAYNAYLHKRGHGVASNSLHLQGLAIDFRIPKVDMHKLATLARTYRSGGVGTYPDFVHIDAGRVRYW
jgi:uncharacterized protein YcbK (DUF882 family)